MKFLIVVDMQNDFITGSLGTKEAEAILPKVLEKIRTYRPEQIFVTQDTHPDNYTLPAHRGALVQRVVTVAQLLDDVFQTAAPQTSAPAAREMPDLRYCHPRNRRYPSSTKECRQVPC